MNNHTNVSESNFLILFLPPLSLSLILSFIIYYFIAKRKKLYLIPLGVNMLAIAFFILIDRFNILVEQDEWFARGMPAAFEKSNVKKIYTNPELDKIDGELSLWGRRLLGGEITQEEFNRESERLIEERRKVKQKNP
jgi:hypothetical protein